MTPDDDLKIANFLRDAAVASKEAAHYFTEAADAAFAAIRAAAQAESCTRVAVDALREGDEMAEDYARVATEAVRAATTALVRVRPAALDARDGFARAITAAWVACGAAGLMEEEAPKLHS